MLLLIEFELKINTSLNEPEILSDTIKEWNKDHGTKIQIDLEATLSKRISKC
jgi:DNA topoisomerase VI subunit B